MVEVRQILAQRRDVRGRYALCLTVADEVFIQCLSGHIFGIRRQERAYLVIVQRTYEVVQVGGLVGRKNLLRSLNQHLAGHVETDYVQRGLPNRIQKVPVCVQLLHGQPCTAVLRHEDVIIPLGYLDLDHERDTVQSTDYAVIGAEVRADIGSEQQFGRVRLCVRLDALVIERHLVTVGQLLQQSHVKSYVPAGLVRCLFTDIQHLPG